MNLLRFCKQYVEWFCPNLLKNVYTLHLNFKGIPICMNSLLFSEALAGFTMQDICEFIMFILLLIFSINVPIIHVFTEGLCKMVYTFGFSCLFFSRQFLDE